jgi:murein DD-endopeptidase MepM/ murein hydrolase activator NlpD
MQRICRHARHAATLAALAVVAALPALVPEAAAAATADLRDEAVLLGEPGDLEPHGHDHSRGEELDEERDLAVAATWQLDPELLEPLPTDSRVTLQARRLLADTHARLLRKVTAYDAAVAAAESAEAEADRAAATLETAQGVLAVATVEYQESRRLLVGVITEGYAIDSVGAFGRLFSAESEEDLVNGLMVVQQMGRNQSAVVEEADAARERLRAATAVVRTAAAESRRSLEAARAAVKTAADARTKVLREVREARRLVQESVLADELAAAAAAAAVKGIGDVAFPLPAGASFVDQDNWGARSKRWATMHTGDDFSTACGTPVLAATSGTVLVRTDQSWSGKWLVMVQRRDGGLTTWYGHMQALTVEHGDKVKAGKPVGLVGTEGNSTGCHLHFEVHPSGGGIYEDNVDPAEWLRAAGAYPG